jgi:hypothetical protein
MEGVTENSRYGGQHAKLRLASQCQLEAPKRLFALGRSSSCPQNIFGEMPPRAVKKGGSIWGARIRDFRIYTTEGLAVEA